MPILSRTEWQRIFQQANTGSVTLTATTAVAAAATAGGTLANIPGASIGDIVDVSSPAVQPVGLLVFGVVTAAGVVTIYFLNPTAGSLTGVAGLYKVATYPFTTDVA